MPGIVRIPLAGGRVSSPVQEAIMKRILLAALLTFAVSPALAADDDDCKAVAKELEAKMLALGEKDFYLEVVPAAQVKNARVVGSCEAGKMKIVYRRS
jgi:hypothetical protein